MTFTDGLVVGPVQVAPVGKGVPACLGIRAGAFSAGDVDLQGGVTVVAFQADFTVGAVGGIAAAVTVAGQCVTGVSVAVTLTRLKKKMINCVNCKIDHLILL